MRASSRQGFFPIVALGLLLGGCSPGPFFASLFSPSSVQLLAIDEPSISWIYSLSDSTGKPITDIQPLVKEMGISGGHSSTTPMKARLLQDPHALGFTVSSGIVTPHFIDPDTNEPAVVASASFGVGLHYEANVDLNDGSKIIPAVPKELSVTLVNAVPFSVYDYTGGFVNFDALSRSRSRSGTFDILLFCRDDNGTAFTLPADPKATFSVPVVVNYWSTLEQKK